MEKINKKVIIWLAGSLIALAGFLVGLVGPAKLGTAIQETACTVTHSRISVGPNVSVQLLATSSRRLWAQVDFIGAASSTVVASSTMFASFAQDAPAVVGTGISIGSSTPVVFGLKTDFPYTDAVQGIVGAGSTTVLATQCVSK